VKKEETKGAHTARRGKGKTVRGEEKAPHSFGGKKGLEKRKKRGTP